MRRLPILLMATGACHSFSTTVWAAPPSLPAEAAEPELPDEESADAADAAEDAAGEDLAEGESDSFDLAEDGSEEASEDEFYGDESDEGAVEDEDGDDGNSDDPGYVAGRREPMMNALRGPIGLYHTSLPDVGGKYTVRVRLASDFFRTTGFICCADADLSDDEHGRVRGGVDIGFTVAEWGELYFGVHNSANRNTRSQPGRVDPETVFALGDMNFGFKGAYRFKDGGIGLGGQIGAALLSGSDRLLVRNANFNIDALFAVDLRYLTASKAPVRFSTNVGWYLDNSTKLVDWDSITDPVSREVMRFSLGVNHSRVRTRYAVDFPVRFGKERAMGIDPFVEYSWDFSTEELAAFVPLADANPSSSLPRSRSWATVGARANVYDGLQLSAGVDIGTVAPSFEFGPDLPPWQVILGIGWSIDPKPRVKEVEAEEPEEAAESPVLDGRIIGRVVDASGQGIAGAKVSFPGLAANTLITDDGGNFTSFRFPEGEVAIVVEGPGGTSVEATAQSVANEDTQLDITLGEEEAGAAAAGGQGMFVGTLIDPTGAPIKKATVQIKGDGLDEPFECCDDWGRLAVDELPYGTYSATIKAEGFQEQTIQFEVNGPTAEVSTTLQSAAPAETPNVSGTDKRIRLKKKLRYKGNAVSDKSHALLDELATFLNARPEYQVVQIGVHTDDRGNPKSRSNARAKAVREYLITKGVGAGRLTTKGFGDSKPLGVNLTASGRSKNNRTQFKVTQYKQ